MLGRNSFSSGQVSREYRQGNADQSCCQMRGGMFMHLHGHVCANAHVCETHGGGWVERNSIGEGMRTITWCG